MRPLNLLFDHYSNTDPNPEILALCGATERDTPYTVDVHDDLTVIINAWGRPEYLPLVWEAIQYQTCRPKETWVIQNDPASCAPVPRSFLDLIRRGYHSVIIDSGLNHGCWYRFILAALACRTRFIAIYDDDTLSGRLALETGLESLIRRPGIYGGRGITFDYLPGGPSFHKYAVSGWPSGTAEPERVDFVGHLWIMETYWLRDLLRRMPDLFLSSPTPGRECGEDMYVSFVAQRRGLATYVLGHGSKMNDRWSSLQGYRMGVHKNALFKTNGLRHGDEYLRRFVAEGWKLLRYNSDC
jgi:hypothetical protein